MVKMHITDRDGNVTELDGDTDISVMANLRDNDYEMEAICGGQCSCATCHIYVSDDWMDKVGSRSDAETELLEELECYKPDQSRLSCQIKFTEALDGLTFEIAPDE